VPVPVDMRAGQAQGPQVAVDKNGNFLAVWNQLSNTTLQGIWQATSTDNGKSWGPITAIRMANDGTPVLSMNADGAAIVAWDEGVGTTITAWSATRPAGGTWSTHMLLQGVDNGDHNAVVAMSGTGEALALFEQTDGNYDSVWESHLTASGWSTATPFETFDGGPCYGQAIAANTSGQAVGTYLQVGTDGSMKMISRRYTPGSGFSANALQVITANTIEYLVYPSITLDDAGIATVAYSVAQSSGTYQVYASRSGTGDNAWPAAFMIESDDAAADDDPSGKNSLVRVPMPVVAHDPAGNVMLVWRKRTGARFDTWARRYTAGSWGTNTGMMIETHDPNSVFFPAVAAGANGTAVAVWYYGTELTVWGNVFR